MPLGRLVPFDRDFPRARHGRTGADRMLGCTESR